MLSIENRESMMAFRITNPAVVAKIEALAERTGLTKTAAVEMAVDALLNEQPARITECIWDRFDAILAQMDRIPKLAKSHEPIDWDEHGLPG